MAEYKRRVEEAGSDSEWVAAGADPGQGEAIRVAWPAPVPEYRELVYDIERGYDAFPEKERDVKNDPTPEPDRGGGVRHRDHANFDIHAHETTEFMTGVLDFNNYEEAVDGEGPRG